MSKSTLLISIAAVALMLMGSFGSSAFAQTKRVHYGVAINDPTSQACLDSVLDGSPAALSCEIKQEGDGVCKGIGRCSCTQTMSVEVPPQSTAGVSCYPIGVQLSCATTRTTVGAEGVGKLCVSSGHIFVAADTFVAIDTGRRHRAGAAEVKGLLNPQGAGRYVVGCDCFDDIDDLHGSL